MRGPVLDHYCKSVCQSCRLPLLKGLVPKNALANGFWIGEVPDVLKDLNWIEQLLVAKVRRSLCYAHVSGTGLKKMKAHLIAFEAPVPKVYQVLPPSVTDLDDVLAILFTGPCKPTLKELSRLPLLVRRNNVQRVLEWLKLNHSDYNDLEISYSNLEGYLEDVPPVSIVHHESAEEAATVNPAAHDGDKDMGVGSGDCPFVVHGLTGESLSAKTMDELKGLAMQHWESNRKALRVGHSTLPKNSFNDPHLYPQMFPWLFPYGLGGIGANEGGVSVQGHKASLLMYHDKQFQLDTGFPFAAFSQEQVKAATSSGYLAAEHANFKDIAERLVLVNQKVFATLAKRMADGEIIKPTTEEEKACFHVIDDLD
ncbi:hypothetical protein C0995_013891, partial [Termitomyces sp. Mi166